MATTIYDFSKPKVRKNGRVLDKYDLSQELKHFNYWRFLYCYDVMSYAEMKYELSLLV